MAADDYPTRLALAQEVVRKISDHMQGSTPEAAELHEDRPKNMFPCGALHPPEEGADEVEQFEAEFAATEYTPSALGFAIKVPQREDIAVEVAASLLVYYPVQPTHAEVLAFLARFAPDDAVVEIPPKYKRVHIAVPWTGEQIQLRPTDGFQPLPNAQHALNQALGRAGAAARADPALFGVERGKRRKQTELFQTAHLRDPAFWQRHIDHCARKSQPEWSGNVLHRVREAPDGWILEVLICNETRTEDPALEDVFIGVQLEARGPAGTLLPTRLHEVEARDYRHDPVTYASGRNCDTIADPRGDPWHVRTESVPVYVQRRLAAQEWTARERPIHPTFKALSTPAGLDLLDDIARAMRDYLAQWDGKARGAPGYAADPAQADAGRADFEAEVQRFEQGIAALRDARNRDALAAFCLMNQAFDARFTHAGQPGSEWRLFQVAFIVSELCDVVDRATRPGWTDRPSVLRFPTGGGKTEAYLGLVLFHAFWDRLRGKPYGVTAIAKFPLRMLSLQQFSRVVALFEQAEDIRRASPELRERGDPFSIGYYAGGGNTLNLLDYPVAPDRTGRPSSWSREFAPVRANAGKLAAQEARHRKVPYCPVCVDSAGRPGRVRTTFDELKPGFRHECERCHRVLNLHVTDTEVLRWLPTFVIATIDKLARLATEPWGRALMGEAAARCEQHGYLYTAPHDAPGKPVMQCPVLGCGRPLFTPPRNVDPVPSILVQDELHLLTESLGAFASHYETMLSETLRRNQARGVGRGPWHVVGSTATIEGYRQLVRQLYNKPQPRRFPVPGPKAGESFYVRETDEHQRIVVGVRPHGMTHVDTVMKLLLVYHRALWRLVDPPTAGPGHALPDAVAGVAPAEAAKLARRYRTSLTYGINRNEVAQVNNSFAGQLNPVLEAEGCRGFDPDRVLNLTGDNEIEEIQDFLDKMENDVPDYPQAVTATSIIGHGVDLDHLNFMVFRGMPHRMAEYIQASSRVGRRAGVPAVVVNVYNPNRERDASHFESHRKYLEFREILIRNIPTTRFSTQALERTIPGLLLHYVNYADPPVDVWKKTTVEGLLREVTSRKAELVEAVRRELGIPDAPDPDSPLVKRQADLVEQLVARVRTDLQRNASTQGDASNKAAARLRALQSLRDTDQQISVFSGGSLEEVS